MLYYYYYYSFADTIKVNISNTTVEVKENGNLTLYCQTNNDQWNVTWLVTSLNHTSTSENGMATLQLYNVTSDHHYENITCMVSSDEDYATERVLLLVLREWRSCSL